MYIMRIYKNLVYMLKLYTHDFMQMHADLCYMCLYMDLCT